MKPTAGSFNGSLSDMRYATPSTVALGLRAQAQAEAEDCGRHHDHSPYSPKPPKLSVAGFSCAGGLDSHAAW